MLKQENSFAACENNESLKVALDGQFFDQMIE